MGKHTVNGRFWAFFIFLISVLILGIKAVVMLFTGQVADENGESLGTFGIFAGCAVSLVLLTYLISFLTMLCQLLFHKGNAFQVTDKGIENTFVFVIVLAFIFVVPVKLITWSSAKYAGTEKEFEIRASVKKIKAGPVARLIIKLAGYNFCSGFIKPQLSENEKMLIKDKIQGQ